MYAASLAKLGTASAEAQTTGAVVGVADLDSKEAAPVVEEVVTVLNAKPVWWKAVDQAYKTGEGTGAVVHLMKTLPAREQFYAVRTALRNARHREVMILLAKPEYLISTCEQAEAYEAGEQAWAKANDLGDIKDRFRILVVSSREELNRELRRLSKEFSSGMDQFVHSRGLAPVTETFILAGSSDLLDLVEKTDEHRARLVETVERKDVAFTGAQKVALAEVADELYSNPLGETTYRYLKQADGRRYQVIEKAVQDYSQTLWAKVLASMQTSHAA